MTIAFGSGATSATFQGGNNTGVGGVSIAITGTVAAGNMLVIPVGLKPDTLSDPVVVDNLGNTWAMAGSAAGGTGTFAADTGPTKVAWFYTVAVGGETSVTVTTSNATGQVFGGAVQRYTKTASSWATPIFTSGADTTNGTGWSATGGSITTLAGDILLAAAIINGDLFGSGSGHTLTQAGATLGTHTLRIGNSTNLGNDMGINASDRPVTTGATGAPTYVFTTTGAGSGITGFLVLREQNLTTVTSDLDIRWKTFQQINSDLDVRWWTFARLDSDLDIRWAVAGPPGAGGGAVVQQVTGSNASAANFTTSAVTTQAANVLAILVGRSGGLGTGALTSVTDPVGNTWTMITRGAVSGQANTRVELWATTQNVGPLTTQAITCNSGTAQSNDYSILELSGLDKAALVHASSPDGSGVTSAAPSTPTLTTTVQTMVLSVLHHAYNATADSVTSPAGSTLLTRSVNGTVHETDAAYWTQVAAGSPSGTWARGGSVNSANGTITVAFTESTAGTTTVTSDLDLRWITYGRVNSDLDLRWATLVRVDSDLDLRWRLWQRVNSDLDLRWATLVRLNSDLDLRWRVLTRVTSDLDIRWVTASSLTTVLSDLDLRWRVLTRITSDHDLRWATLTRITSDHDLRWRVLTRLDSDLDLRWRLWQRVNSDLDLRWATLARVNSDLDLRWALLSRVTSDHDLRWRVLLRVASDLDIRWATSGPALTTVLSDLDLRWRTYGRVNSDLDIRWRLLQRLTADHDLRWRVLTRVNSDHDLRWAVLSRLTSDLTIHWAVLSRLNSDLALRWAVLGRVDSDLDLRWRTYEQVVSDLTLLWFVMTLGPVKASKALTGLGATSGPASPGGLGGLKSGLVAGKIRPTLGGTIGTTDRSP